MTQYDLSEPPKSTPTTIIQLFSVVLPLIARDPTWEEFENTEAD